LRGVGGQNWVKFGPHSCGRIPKVQLEHEFIHQYTLHVCTKPVVLKKATVLAMVCILFREKIYAGSDVAKRS
jgi:hypothetical protein